MTSVIDVCNMALDQAGARFSVSSLNPPLPPPNAIVVARLYQPKIDALHRAAHWNCCRLQTKLTLLKAAKGTPENPNGALPVPPVPYIYEYAYPPDCLKARYLLHSRVQSGQSNTPILGGGVTETTNWSNQIGSYPFAVAIDTDSSGNQIKVILTDLEFAEVVYTGRIVDPDLWDPHFLAAACATLAAWCVNPLARNAQVLKEQIEIASSIITQARVSDGNEGVTSVDHVPDWMAVRATNGWGILENGARGWYGWDGIGFPGGIFV